MGQPPESFVEEVLSNPLKTIQVSAREIQDTKLSKRSQELIQRKNNKKTSY